MLSTIAKIDASNANKSTEHSANTDNLGDDLSDDMLGLTLNASVQQQPDNLGADDKKNEDNCDSLNKQSNIDIDGEVVEDLPNIHSHSRVGGGGGGGGLQQSTKSTKSATSSKSQSLSGDRRGRPPPPSTQSTKRELKSSSMSSKQVPDSR